jgi:hypothetical protein
MPTMLEGLCIYTDASLLPDQNFTFNRDASLGVFLLSSGTEQNRILMLILKHLFTMLPYPKMGCKHLDFLQCRARKKLKGLQDP